MATWFAAKRAGGFPVVGAVDASGKLLGFGSWGTFRAFPRTSTRWSTASTCITNAVAADWASACCVN